MTLAPGSLIPGTSWDPAGPAAALRHRVFVIGQGVDPAVEADDLDQDPATTHAVIGDSATGRLVDPGDPVGFGRVGRMAVEESARGSGLGLQALRLLEGAARSRGLIGVELHAQLSARGFYNRAGYVPLGDVYLEQGIEHVTMRRSWLPGLRPVRAEEALAVQDLIGGCFAEYPGCVLDLDDLDAWMVSPADRPLWVVPSSVVPGRLDGCVCVGTGAELKSLYVRKAARGAGWGTSLVNLAVRNGARELWSDTRFADAHRLYERLGWVRQPGTRDLNDPSSTTEYQFTLA